MKDGDIYVTRPFLPELAEFLPYLEAIWKNRILTNSGPFHEQLETALANYLGVSHISLFANATLGLIAALRACRAGGEVITTPFSFVATAHALGWVQAKPVFVDIDSDDYNIDPDRIERAITPATSAILPVHVYGRPCNVDRIDEIGRRHGLPVIYDAAHAFGVTRSDNRSLFLQGDMSVLSFHATKVFNTFEGGAVVSSSAEQKLVIDRIKNFGIADEVTVTDEGFNGKLNEFQAALGLLQLKHIDGAIERRRHVEERYRAGLLGRSGILLSPHFEGYRSNHAYFPIQVTGKYPLTRDELYDRLRQSAIFARRYFFPLISEMPMYRPIPSADVRNLPNAHRAASEILCLPIYPDLSDRDVDRVIESIIGV